MRVIRAWGRAWLALLGHVGLGIVANLYLALALVSVPLMILVVGRPLVFAILRLGRWLASCSLRLAQWRARPQPVLGPEWGGAERSQRRVELRRLRREYRMALRQHAARVRDYRRSVKARLKAAKKRAKGAVGVFDAATVPLPLEPRESTGRALACLALTALPLGVLAVIGISVFPVAWPCAWLYGVVVAGVLRPAGHSPADDPEAAPIALPASGPPPRRAGANGRSGRGRGARETSGAPAGGGGARRRSGHGIVGMRERVAALGGTLDVGPTPDGGFEVVARLPVGSERRTP
jgi:hypothetical protein